MHLHPPGAGHLCFKDDSTNFNSMRLPGGVYNIVISVYHKSLIGLNHALQLKSLVRVSSFSFFNELVYYISKKPRNLQLGPNFQRFLPIFRMRVERSTPF